MAKLHATSASLAGALLLLGAVACNASNDDDERAEQAPEGARCPVVTRGGDCRAAGPSEVVTVASKGLLLPAAGFAIGNGGFLAFSVRWGDAHLLASRSSRPWVFDAAATLPWDAAKGATGATSGGGDVLYFIAKLGSASSSLHVSRVEQGELGAPAPVELEGSLEVPSWPQAVGLADGRVLLAFVVPQRRVLLGVDDGTGTRFRMNEVPLSEPDMSGVLAHVGTTAHGAWVLTYQVADSAWRFRSHVLVSQDEGRSWSDAQVGQLSAGDDVSDAFPIARRDRGADVYYVKKDVYEPRYVGNKKAEATVYRRSVSEDGALGPEQLVTSSRVGVASKPQPRRLPDGKIAMMLTLERSRTDKDLALVVLDGDAP